MGASKVENFDVGVKRAWERKSSVIRQLRKPFYWYRVSHDPLLERQVYMMREGRQALHNMIRGDHGLPNRY